jgi:hypothetical protein
MNFYNLIRYNTIFFPRSNISDVFVSAPGAGVAQSVSRLATAWRVRGSNPGGGRDFPHPYRPALRPIQPPIQWVPPTPSSAEVKERVEL